MEAFSYFSSSLCFSLHFFLAIASYKLIIVSLHLSSHFFFFFLQIAHLYLTSLFSHNCEFIFAIASFKFAIEFTTQFLDFRNSEFTSHNSDFFL